MSKIVSLTGAPIHGQSSPEIVALLEQALEEAQRGEIIGIAIAKVRPNKTVRHGYEHGSGDFGLLAAVDLLHHDMLTDALASGHDVIPDGAA